MKERYTDHELLYAAGARCNCGAGMAYPPGEDTRTWLCSRALRGEVAVVSRKSDNLNNGALEPVRFVDAEGSEHIALPFWCFEVKSESQPSAEGRTTRPAGTHVENEPQCECKKCGHKWTAPRHRPSEGWRARLAGHDCPSCGATYLRPGTSITSMDIDARYLDVVVDDAPAAGVSR